MLPRSVQFFAILGSLLSALFTDLSVRTVGAEGLPSIDLMQLMSTHKYRQALALVRAERKFKPMDCSLMLVESKALLKLGNIKESLILADKAISLNADCEADAYCRRAEALVKLDKPEQALDSCNRALQLRPDLAGAFLARGAADLKLKHYEESLRDCADAIALPKPGAEAYCLRAEIALSLEQHERAIKDCQKALQIDSSCSDAYRLQSSIYRELKKPDLAKQMNLKAKELDAAAR